MKVAKIIDRYTVAITRKGEWLAVGDTLAIGGDPVIDPETGETIGELPLLRVKVTQVFEKFVIAETYRLVPALASLADRATVTVNVGDDVMLYVP